MMRSSSLDSPPRELFAPGKARAVYDDAALAAPRGYTYRNTLDDATACQGIFTI